MDALLQIKKLLERGVEYLYQTRLCDEDHLTHGRRAYVWPLQRWLHQHEGSERLKREACMVADELYPTVHRNPSGEMVIYPGLHGRRNYSTNAIDCGTFVDSFFDQRELRKSDPPHPLTPKVREVASTYLLKKITGYKDVHDQYLWAATGLARYLSEHEQDAEAERYPKALEDTLEFWMKYHEEDGYSPYMNSDPFMGGLTPYYFSRRIAFSWYILEKAKLNRPDIEEKLLKAARFLATLLRPDGVKEMRLEAKRYYFWGSYEADSHPFDIYVFYKTYAKTKDDRWLDISAVSLRRLLGAQTPNGAIRSRASEGGVRDWQCDTMRTGHLAWLTRIPDDFLANISARTTEQLRTPYDFTQAKASDRVLLIGNDKKWIHFVTRKGIIAGHAGERVSGIIAGEMESINRLDEPCLFHYRTRGNLLLFLKHNKKGIFASFQYSLFHVWDCLFHKKELALAWAFLRNGLFGYLSTGLGTVSTEFATEVTGLTVSKNAIHHDLTLTDFSGNQMKVIGRREIQWDETAVTIEDTLTTEGKLHVLLPEGIEKCRGPRVMKSTYPLHNANVKNGL